MVVKPKVLPEPLDFIVRTLPPASKLAAPLQVEEIFCGAVTVTTTVQVLAPVTVTEELYRSPQTVPGVNVAVQVPEPVTGAVDGELVGVVVPPALSASRTDVYAAFLAPEPLNSSGFSPERHESLSRMPHTVTPVQRDTARHALVTVA